MRRARNFIALIAFAFVFHAVAVADAYFSLSTDRTFLPGEKTTVHLYTRDVSALEFRLYRVNDPVLFFETLRDVHGFGVGHYGPKEQVEEKTRIERYHDWKHGMWVSIRDFFRGQFSASSRASMREAQGRKQKSQLGTATLFAQVPLLNDKQLVARWRQQVPSTFISERQDVPVESLERGAYVVEATDGQLRAYTVLMVSDLALITKSAPGQLLAYSVERRSGTPVSGAQVEIWNARKQVAAGKTDDQGLRLISLSAASLPASAEDMRIVATHGNDVALVAPYNLNVSSDPGEDWTGYVYTDRPVYRPGHPVHFKGIMRARNGEKYRVPSGMQVQMTVQDTNGKQIYQSTGVLSQFGAVHGDLTLPADASLGYYSVSINAGGKYPMNGGFQVEEYKKPEYEVRVIPDRPRLLEGNQATATIEAKYYFGEPVAGAQVKYVVHRSTYWYPFFSYEGADEDYGQGLAGEGEGDAEGGEYDYGGEQLSEQTGKLDGNGRLKIAIPTTLDKHKQDLRYRIEARVTDESRREISGYNSVIATYGSFRIGVNADKYMYQPGETMTFTVTAKDYDGNPVQTAFHLELAHWNFRQREANKVIQASDGQTGKDGTATLKLTAQAAGSVTAKVTARTPENREVEGTAWLWIPGAGESTWYWQQNNQVQIIPDKKSYKPGETAHLMVMTNVAGPHILITTEGRTIQSRRVIQGKTKDDKSVMVDIPITTDNQPNVFVSATFVHDNTLYTGTKNLKVPADQQRLNVTIEPSQPQFAPGQAASYTITAKDAAGNPVAGDFSLGVVDEAIYAIEPDNVQDIYSVFYGATGDRVGTDSSLSFFFTGEAGNKPMILATEFTTNHRRLAQLKPEALVQPKIRKLFPDTALWLADVHTDQSGRCQAQLTFPDSLTTWRATVRGATLDTKVGSATNKVIVRKNVMVRLAVPRFFRQGDDVTVSTIVHNYLPDAKDVQMSLDVKGLTRQETGTQQANVASKADQRADWHVHAQNVRESDLLAKALTNQESDALELTLPVIPFGVKLPDVKSGAIAQALGQAQATINLPGDPTTAAPSLSVSISPSIAGSIFGALEFLTSYPYGCTEQTMSSFLPNVVVAKAMKDLNLQSDINTPELEKKIHAGLERLYDYQHDDGGWGWWKEDESYVFMTAYVVSGLAQAKGSGYEIKPEAVTNGEKFLKQQLQKYPKMRPDLRAYVVYALALDKTSDSKMLDDAYGRRGDMSSQGLSMLGLALHTAGDSRDRAVAAMIEKQALVDDSEAHWPSDYDYLMEFYIDDSVESTAYALRLLSQTKPDSPLLPKAAAYLVNHRDGGYYWLSTKQTSMVVFGLLEYVKVTHEFDADFNADVFVNDSKVLSRHFTKADTMKSQLPRVNLPTEQLRQGANSVRIQKTGAGRLYWSARGEYYTTEKKYFQNNKFSLNITRDYYRLVPQQVEDRIVYDLQPVSGTVNSGDVIAVRLSVNGSEWRYLLVEDPIPAGAEFIQHDNLYELKQKTDWWGFWYTRREFWDDHAAFFQTYFDGHKEYVYLLKIVNPGKFRISPASVQPMYQPSVLATTDAATMEAK